MVKSNIDYLRNLPPFKNLTDEKLNSLEDHISIVEYPQGEVIFSTGDEGDCFYVIKSGEVRVFIQAPGSSEKIVLSDLAEGDYFGEMALLTGGPRSASVETMTDVSLIHFEKKGFEKLLEEDPTISISISHMLSQRLMQANLQRVAAEQFYKSKISPSGSLRDHPIMEILKFCEENSLTGRLYLEHHVDKAEILFLKGNVQRILLKDLGDAEAMDTITQWEDGKFKIEPSLFSLEENILINKEVTETTKRVEKEAIQFDDIPVVIEDFLRLSFEKLIDLIGSQKLKEIAIRAHQQCKAFFPTLENCTFEFFPEIKLNLQKGDNWTDKHTLGAAVYLETVFKNCQNLVFGMAFLDLEELAGDKQQQLKQISFFDYMNHAKEFAL